jgi:PAS domain S-box-containing protein
MYCVVKDITERKLLEESLDKTRRLFETFMNHSPLVGWITDEKGVMQYMNDLFLDTYGFSKRDIGKDLYSIFSRQDAVDNHLNNLRVLQEGKALETIEKAVLPSGKQQVLKTFKFPIQIDGVNMIAGWAVDITAQMELQQELEHSIERYQYANEATSDAIFEWDLLTNVMQRGPGFTRIFDKELDSKPFHEDIHPEDRPHVIAVVQEALADPATDRFQIEYRFKGPLNTYKQLISKAFIIRQEGRAVRIIGAIQDVTAQRKLQAELNKVKVKKEVVKSLHALQEKERKSLSAELHDNVNQMLTSCKLMLEYVGESNQAAPGLLKKCQQNLQRAINEIRKISHELNPSVLEDIGLAEAIEELIEKINITGKLKIYFKNNLSDGLTLKEEAKITLYRIIQEQLCNILKHAGASKVLLMLSYKEGTVLLSLEDDGKGFDVQKVKQGLGLKNIRDRVAYYAGTYSIVSEPGKGCKVDVKLPIFL